MLIDGDDAAADAAGIEFVKRFQPRVPHWWLMYSRRKRSLVAFYQGNCPPPGLVVEAEHPDELLKLMSLGATALWRSPADQPAQPPARTGNLSRHGVGGGR
ncbi:hypothetical protein [Nonomuraea angiospora]|uniref:hypothetical protein n=1 Tax=Nonomuraea angiospora TaxID=46172 RepID=UPI0029A95287|nr:hypothetical protein [Nonomuraea angiospora]MDX3106075.1 hypothetical protein [Nonomuraea angiospora]